MDIFKYVCFKDVGVRPPRVTAPATVRRARNHHQIRRGNEEVQSQHQVRILSIVQGGKVILLLLMWVCYLCLSLIHI